MRLVLLFSTAFGSDFSDMEKKRGSAKGFDGPTGLETLKHQKNWRKNKALGNWRKFDDEVKVEYTILERCWIWKGDEDEDPFTEKHIAPWGMVKEATSSLLSDNVGNAFKSLPSEVKNHFSALNSSNFNKRHCCHC